MASLIHHNLNEGIMGNKSWRVMEAHAKLAVYASYLFLQLSYPLVFFMQSPFKASGFCVLFRKAVSIIL